MNNNLDLAWDLEKIVEYELNGDTNCSWCPWNSPKKSGRIKVYRKKKDHPDQGTVKIGKNT